MADIVQPVVVPMDVSASDQVFDFSTDTAEIPMEVDVVVVSGSGQHYTGETAITPSEEEQVLETADLIVDDNIRIAKIPSNYGRIVWNGTSLLVY